MNELFNPLDQFLTAKRVLLRLKTSEQLSNTSLTCHILSLQKTSVYTNRRSDFPEIPPLYLFTRDVFRLIFSFAHRVPFHFYQHDPSQLVLIAHTMAGKTSENDFLRSLLNRTLPGKLSLNAELSVLKSLNFDVGTEFFEDFVDSALMKICRVKGVEIDAEMEKQQDFVVMMVQVSQMQRECSSQVCAIFAACEIFLMRFGGVRGEIYALSKHDSELRECRKYLVFGAGKEDELFGLESAGIDLVKYEAFLRGL